MYYKVHFQISGQKRPINGEQVHQNDTNRVALWGSIQGLRRHANGDRGGAVMATRAFSATAKGTRLLTVRQAAEYLGTTPATLYTKVWRREIPFIKLGRSVRFDVIDLDQLIADSKVKPRELSGFDGDCER
jgi:excisionase family DNA binding protein